MLAPWDPVWGSVQNATTKPFPGSCPLYTAMPPPLSRPICSSNCTVAYAVGRLAGRRGLAHRQARSARLREASVCLDRPWAEKNKGINMLKGKTQIRLMVAMLPFRSDLLDPLSLLWKPFSAPSCLSSPPHFFSSLLRCPPKTLRPAAFLLAGHQSGSPDSAFVLDCLLALSLRSCPRSHAESPGPLLSGPAS